MVSEQTIANSIPNLIQCELCKSLSKTIRTLYPQGDNGDNQATSPFSGLAWKEMMSNDERKKEWNLAC